VLTVALVGFGLLMSSRFQAAGHPEVTSEVWGALVGQLVGTVFVGVLFGWLIVAGVLYVLCRAAVSHEGTFAETLVVAGWGIVPTVLDTLVSFVLLALALQGASFATPETFLEQFRANLNASGGLQALLAFLVATWQTYVYGKGLSVGFDDSSGTAWLVGGLVAYGTWLLSV
jgi:hypothetical protein